MRQLSSVAGLWLAAATVTSSAAAVRPQAGQHGEGLTVFSGQQIERFDVEFLGELARWGATGDVLLARLSGGPLAQTGVLQGMSGSPVYVDGELVGAVAATWPYAKEPLAAIRPIDEMRRIAEDLQGGAHPTWKPGMREAAAPALDLAPWRARLVGSGAVLPSLFSIQAPAVAASPPDWSQWLRASAPPADPTLDLAAIVGGEQTSAPARRAVGFGGDVVWLASGFQPQVRAAIASTLGATVLASPVAAPSGSGANAADTDSAGPMRPGDAMAVLLVDGDARLGAVGTLTERVGDTVIGFGHPLLDAGPISLPLAPAHVVALMPGSEISFKFATADRAAGALLFDRSAGVCGQLGVRADMLPVALRVASAGGREDNFHFEVARHPMLMPPLVQWTVQAGVAAGHENVGESTGQLEVRVNIAGESPIVNRAVVSGLGASSALGDEISLPLALLALNDERVLRIDSVDVALDLRAGLRTARLGRVVVEPAEPHPGDLLRIRVELLPHRAQPQWLELQLQVPASTAAGNYQLRVCDGASAFRDEISRALPRWQSPGVRQVREAFAMRRPASVVSAVLYGAPQGVIVRGRELGQLPPSALAVLTRAHGTPNPDVVAATPIVSAEQTTEWVVDGSVRIAVVVKEPFQP